MSLTALQLTRFKVEKLQCIGGEGRAVPFRVTTYRGMDVGSLGEIMEFRVETGNDAFFEIPASKSFALGIHRLLSPFRRAHRG